MRIVLVRHGETTYNRQGRVQGRLDTRLTERGIEQAEQVADALEHGFEAVYSSTLQRTYRTARVIAPHVQITALPSLTGIDMGTATGMRKGGLHDVLDEAADRGELWQPPHGEQPERFQDRVSTTMEGIADRHEGRVLVVTHGGVVRAYRRHLSRASFATAHRLPVENGDITVLDPENGVVGERNVY